MIPDLISIIVPIYNVEAYLPKCLASIASQTYPYLEIILIDDGSSDRSGIICDDFAEKDPRTNVVHQENKHTGPTRNVGLQIASGKYIMFVDGDDYIHPDTVEILHRAINSDRNYDLSIGGYKEVFTSTAVNFEKNCSEKIEHIVLTQERLFEQLFGADGLNFSSPWSKLYKRTAIEGILFNDHISEDFDYNIRAFQKVQSAVWVKYPLYYYVQRGGSAFHAVDARRKSFHAILGFLANNLAEMTQPPGCYYRHYLVRRAYEIMTYLIQDAIGSEGYKAERRLCLQHEKTLRKEFWNDRHFGFVYKVKMTMSILCPKSKKFLKTFWG